MGEKLKDLTPEQARLMRIEVLRELAAELADYARPDDSGHPTTGASDETPGDLVRLPLTDAVIEVIKISQGPQNAKQIWAVLEKSGREVESEHPVQAVQWALKKQLGKNTDLVSVGWGQWDLWSKYKTKTKLERIIKKRAGRGGKSTAEHAVETKKGMEEARAAGKQIGAPQLAVPLLKEVCRLIKTGTKKAKACRAVGIPTSTYYLYYGMYDLNAWDCESWPPPERTFAKSNRGGRGHVRLVASNE